MFRFIAEKYLQHYRQVVRYTVIGILCFLVNYAIALSLENYIYPLLSASIGYIVGVVLNYLFSIKWVFTKREHGKEWKKEFFYFLLIEICAMLFMLGSLFVLQNPLRIKFAIAIVIANFMAAIWNYLAKHLFLFRKHSAETRGRRQ